MLLKLLGTPELSSGWIVQQSKEGALPLTEKMRVRPSKGEAHKASAELGLRGWVALGLPFTSQPHVMLSPVLHGPECQHTEALQPWHVHLRAIHGLICSPTNLSLSLSPCRSSSSSLRGEARSQPSLRGSKWEPHQVGKPPPAMDSEMLLFGSKVRVHPIEHRVPSPSQVTPSTSLSW